MRKLLPAALALALLFAALGAPPAHGLALGERPPLLSLSDTSGKVWQLEQLPRLALLLVVLSPDARADGALYARALNARAALWEEGIEARVLLILAGAPRERAKAWLEQALPDANARKLVVLADPDAAYSRALGWGEGVSLALVLDPKHVVRYIHRIPTGQPLPLVDALAGELALAAARDPSLTTDTLTIYTEGRDLLVVELGTFRAAFYYTAGYAMGAGQVTAGIPLYHESLELVLGDGAALYQSFAGKVNETVGLWTQRIGFTQEVFVHVAGRLIDGQGTPSAVAFWKSFRFRQSRVEVSSRVTLPSGLSARSVLNRLVLPEGVRVEVGEARKLTSEPSYGECWAIEQTLWL